MIVIAEFCALTTFLQPLNNVLAICVCGDVNMGLKAIRVRGGHGFGMTGTGGDRVHALSPCRDPIYNEFNDKLWTNS